MSATSSVLERPSVEAPAKSARRESVCILIENLPAPFDRRVWQEARALTEAGYQVSIICPKGLGLNSSYDQIDGIDIYRHRTWEASRPWQYFFEYSWALAAQFFLALKVYRRTRFRVLQACNPPDMLFVIGAFFKLLGVRFVFDHHDLCPELFEAKFGKRGVLYRLVCLFERLTFRCATVSIATNESYRDLAVERGGILPGRVFIVRSCLDLRKVRKRPPNLALKRGKPLLVVYLGVMEAQDGIDLLLQSVASLVRRHGRQDAYFVLIGSGTEVPRLKAMASQMGLGDVLTFTGRISDEELEMYLSTADVAVAPDPATPMNDKSTMNKILHYMSYGLPIVQYDLTEGRRSAGNASLYARSNDPEDFALRVAELLDAEPLRKKLGECGRKRIEEKLNWQVEKEQLLRAYHTALQSEHA